MIVISARWCVESVDSTEGDYKGSMFLRVDNGENPVFEWVFSEGISY